MSTENERPEEPDEQSVEYTKPDFMLQLLVKFANRLDMGLGVTLTVGGILVSGTLVGGKRFFEHMTRDVEARMTGNVEFGRVLAKGLRGAAEGYPLVQPGEEVDDEGPDPFYIHLQGAQFFHPGGEAIPSDEGSWWRGRLSSVDGFVIGSLNPGIPS